MKIEGVIEFPNGFPIQFESLNKEFPIIISDVSGILSTPAPSTDFNKEQKRNLLKPPNSSIKTKNFIWGSIREWPSGLSHIPLWLSYTLWSCGLKKVECETFTKLLYMGGRNIRHRSSIIFKNSL